MRKDRANDNPESFTASAFYLEQLLPAEQILYRQIAHDLCVQQLESIFSGNTDIKRLSTVARYVTLDNPGIYWSKGDFTVFLQDGMFKVLWDDLCPSRWKKQIDEKIFRTVENLGLNRFSSLMDKVLYLQEWFLSNVKYDQGTDKYQQQIVQTIFPVFTEGKGVCLGIAKAAKLMLDLSGNRSVIILGRLFQDKTYEHAWNLIWTGNRFLHADFTVAYPVFEPLWHSCYPGREQSCLLVTREKIACSHNILPGMTYPDILPE